MEAWFKNGVELAWTSRVDLIARAAREAEPSKERPIVSCNTVEFVINRR